MARALNGICQITNKACDDGECYHGCIKMYPADGGLKNQVRSYDETEGVAALLRGTFFADEMK